MREKTKTPDSIPGLGKLKFVNTFLYRCVSKRVTNQAQQPNRVRFSFQGTKVFFKRPENKSRNPKLYSTLFNDVSGFNFWSRSALMSTNALKSRQVIRFVKFHLGVVEPTRRSDLIFSVKIVNFRPGRVL